MNDSKFKNFITNLRLAGYSEQTIKSYLYYNKKFLNFIKKEPKLVTRYDIKEYMTSLLIKNLKERSRNAAHNALKAYYDGFMKKRLFNNIKRSKIPNDMPNILSKEEIESMIENTNNIKHRLLIELLYSSGMRIGECLKVKVKDIDTERRIIFIKNGKGKKDRYVITSKKFIQDLKYYLKTRKFDSKFVFDNKHSHLRERTAQQILRQAAYRAGLQKRVYPHLLRACFATHLLEQGERVYKIQKLLGHARRKTTEIYLGYRTDDIVNIESPLDK